ncbi:hypothetical protein BJ322DRAFT_1107429 [Thelephora terrestris]|uniref:G domain-containing protein n=1 Tax=Thelephora terrestris TaxID=56493 RepID=A0A9P6HIH4_9AGAM|nr:hypothetical protein BJ322DRAFT_1107429 [Thelephora terrestris]
MCTRQEINVPEVAIALVSHYALHHIRYLRQRLTLPVIGATGSGKSSFIDIVSGSNLAVCEGLRPCTDTVQAVDAFDLDGRQVVLIDTPGFDDTTLRDTDVLDMIAAFLATSYERGTTLAGVLYFHRISDPRMTGISRKNFGMFRMLCSNRTLQNAVIVTNMWGEVSLQVGDAREAELAKEYFFFEPALDNGARMARHDNTTSSAENIIRLILDNRPLPLRIQEEPVAEGKDISETSAGEQMQSESRQGADRVATKYQQQIKELQNEKVQLLKQIKHRDGFFSKIGGYLDRMFS